MEFILPVFKAYRYESDLHKAFTKKLLIGVTSEEALLNVKAKIDASSLGGIVGDVVVVNGATVEEQAKAVSAIANKKGLSGIFIDNTINLASMKAEEFAREIAVIKLADDYGIIFTMQNVNNEIRKQIADLIKEILGRDIKNMDAARIFAQAAEKANLPENREAMARLADLAARQREEMTRISGYTEARLAKGAEESKKVAIATTEREAIQDPTLARDMERGEALNVVNVFVYGQIYNTPGQAKAFLRASGYRGNPDSIVYVDKAGKSYESVMRDIYSETRKSGVVEIGIRSASGEFKDIDPMLGKMLEVQELTIDGRKILLTMNTYEALLNIVKSNGTNEDISVALKDKLPGIVYDATRKVFIYLPRTLPINYGEEIETYRNAILLLSSAA